MQHFFHYPIMCNSSSLTITNNLIINSVDTGIYICWASSDSTVVANNTFSNNGKEGIWCYQSSPTIKNNIITPHSSSGISASSSSFPKISYNNVWNNSANHYALSGSICQPGIGDISVLIDWMGLLFQNELFMENYSFLSLRLAYF